MFDSSWVVLERWGGKDGDNIWKQNKKTKLKIINTLNCLCANLQQDTKEHLTSGSSKGLFEIPESTGSEVWVDSITRTGTDSVVSADPECWATKVGDTCKQKEINFLPLSCLYANNLQDKKKNLPDYPSLTSPYQSNN